MLSNGDHRLEFKWLMPHFNRESLIECFHELDGKKAVGADGVTKEEYGRNLEGNIDDLLKRMRTMSYRPGPVREVLIPKDDGKGGCRPLGISNFEDKIVQLMASKVLEAIYEPVFYDCSYGFRPGRSCHMAIKSLSKYLHDNWVETVIDVDLKNFFGTIDHWKLIKILAMKIKDERFLRYITRMLKSGVLSDGGIIVTEEGSPQGSVVSPILANIFAHYALDDWINKIVKRHARRKVEVFRYCDDFVICCRYQSDAFRIRSALDKRMKRFSLVLNESKTKLVRFSKYAYSKGLRQGCFDFLGFNFYIGTTVKGNSCVKVKTSRKRFRSKLAKVKSWIKLNRHKATLKQLWDRFRVKLNGHIRYYGVSFNSRSIRNFLFKSVAIFHKWMNRRSGRRSLNWKKFLDFIKIFPLPKVHIYHSLLHGSW